MDLPAVILTKQQHQEITNALRRALPYGTRLEGPDGRRRLWEAYQKVYREFRFPEWLTHIERYFP